MARITKILTIINEIDREIRQKICWSVKYSEYSGVLFEFGGLIPRTNPIQNLQFSEQERNNVGAVSLFIQTQWIVISPNQMIIGDHLDGKALDSFDGVKISALRINPSDLELRLQSIMGIDLVATLADFDDIYHVRIGKDRWSFGPGPEVIHSVAKL